MGRDWMKPTPLADTMSMHKEIHLRVEASHARRAAVGAALGLTLLSGCQGSLWGTEASPRPPSQRVEFQRMVVGQSVEGRPISCEMYGRSGGETVLIIASIHGTERAGTPLVRRLGQHLRENPDLLDGRLVLLIPETNPDGAAKKTRGNTRGVDLNRNFPARNFSATRQHGPKALSEPESRALHALLAEYQPDRIITLHEPLDCMDYDGPPESKKLAEAMAAVCDLKVKRVGARDGSLGSYAGETLGIPIVTVEFGKDVAGLGETEMWARYGRMLIAAIQFGQPSRRAQVSRTMLP